MVDVQGQRLGVLVLNAISARGLSRLPPER